MIRIALTGRPHLTILRGPLAMEPPTDAEARAERILLLAVCPRCQSEERFLLDADALLAWRCGTLIQKALPQLTNAQRERLMTGYCDPCWREIFADFDDSDGDE